MRCNSLAQKKCCQNKKRQQFWRLSQTLERSAERLQVQMQVEKDVHETMNLRTELHEEGDWTFSDIKRAVQMRPKRRLRCKDN